MVQNFSCGEGGDARDTGLRDMLRDGDFARGTNHVVTHKTQVMTKYMLLERLAVTLGCSTGDKFVVARIQSMDVIANRLQPVVRGSTQWPQDFNAIRRILAHTEDTDEPTFSGPLPEVLSDQQEAHLRKIRLLSGAARNHQKSAYHVAEGNLQYMAFIVQWHASVSKQLRRTPRTGTNGIIHSATSHSQRISMSSSRSSLRAVRAWVCPRFPLKPLGA